jgi:hypothetical protein
VLSHLGQEVAPVLSEVRRVFLEKDTADAVYDVLKNYELFTIRPLWGVLARDVIGPAASMSPGFELVGSGAEAEISPSGEYAAVVTWARDLADCATEWRVRSFVVGIGEGQATMLGSEPYANCGETVEGWTPTFDWSHDSRRAVFLIGKHRFEGLDPALLTLLQTRATEADPTGTADSATTIPGLEALNPRFSADDSVLTVGEVDGQNLENCWVQLRQPARPFGVIGPRAPGTYAVDCASYRRLVVTPNMASSLRRSRSGPVASAFALHAAAGVLDRAPPRRGGGALRVQVN